MKEILLTTGEATLVDDEDYEYLSRFRWRGLQARGKVYAWRTTVDKENGRSQLMHRELLETPRGMATDHINGNSLDNRKSNLRIVTFSQNQMNRGKCKKNTSGYKGVRWDQRKGVWIASIGHCRRNYQLGEFKTSGAAAIAYNKAALKFFGEFAVLNAVSCTAESAGT